MEQGNEPVLVAPAEDVREFEESPPRRSNKMLKAGGVLVVGLVGAAALWSMPGAAALEGPSVGAVCLGQLEGNAGDTVVQFSTAFTNHSSLPVSVTAARVGQSNGLEVLGTRVSAGEQAQGGPVIFGPATLAQQQAEPQWADASELGGGAEVRVDSGDSVRVIFLARPRDAAQEWDAQAANVEVDFHAWTRAPQSSTGGDVFSYSAGACAGSAGESNAEANAPG